MVISRRNASILVSGLVLGLLLVAQWSSPTVQPSAQDYGRDRMAVTIHRLEMEQEELKETLGQLREQLAEHQRSAAASTEMLEEISAALESQRIAAGLVALKGPGVEVILDDSSVQALPVGADLSAYIVHEYDLRDVANLLWQAGSEAMAINDERIVATTSIYCVGSTVMINDTRLSPPYRIQAIGDPALQEGLLRDPVYLGELRQRVKLYGIQFKVVKVGEMTLPAYRGSFLTRYAKAGGMGE